MLDQQRPYENEAELRFFRSVSSSCFTRGICYVDHYHSQWYSGLKYDRNWRTAVFGTSVITVVFGTSVRTLVFGNGIRTEFKLRQCTISVVICETAISFWSNLLKSFHRKFLVEELKVQAQDFSINCEIITSSIWRCGWKVKAVSLVVKLFLQSALTLHFLVSNKV